MLRRSLEEYTQKPELVHKICVLYYKTTTEPINDFVVITQQLLDRQCNPQT